MIQSKTSNTNLVFNKLPISLIMMLVSLTLGYFFNLRPVLQQWSDEKAIIKTLKQNIQHKQQQLVDLATQKREVLRLQQTVQMIMQTYHVKPNSNISPLKNPIIPFSLEFSMNQSLFNEISHAAEANGLIINLFKPLPENNYDFLQEIPIQLTVTGGYLQLIAFIDQLTKFNIMMTFPQFSIIHADPEQSTAVNNSSGNTDKLIMTMTVNIYQFNQNENA